MSVNTFLGLNADEWQRCVGDELPAWSGMVGGPVTIADVRAGLVAMLRRVDEAPPDAHGELSPRGGRMTP